MLETGIAVFLDPVLYAFWRNPHYNLAEVVNRQDVPVQRSDASRAGFDSTASDPALEGSCEDYCHLTQTLTATVDSHTRFEGLLALKAPLHVFCSVRPGSTVVRVVCECRRRGSAQEKQTVG